MAKKVNYIKHPTQNIIDFVATNYGTIDSLFDFINSAGYNSYSDFGSSNDKTIQLEEIQSNEVTSNYRSNRVVVSSIATNEYSTNLICNGDLTFKTLVGGDFNDDFNNDFSRPNLDTVVVGYAGMDLYCIFSVTNSGNKIGTASGTITLEGVETKNWSSAINPGETKEFTVIFEDVQQGLYDVTIAGGCNQVRSIEVLGNINFVSAEDFTILESAPYYAGDSITLEWTINNSGTANGLYEGVWFKNINGNITSSTVSALINSGSSYTFSESVVLEEGLSQFRSSAGQLLNITVLAALSPGTVTYNNDLTLVVTPAYDGEYIAVQWTMTNNTTGDTTVQGFISYSPGDYYINEQWNTSPTPIAVGQTIVFEKYFTVNAGLRTITLTGDAEDSLDFTVEDNNTVYKDVFWVDSDNVAPFTPTYDTVTPYLIQAGYIFSFHVLLVNPTLGDITTNVKMKVNNIFSSLNTNVLVEAESNNTATATLNSAFYQPNVIHTMYLYLDNVLKGELQFKILN